MLGTTPDTGTSAGTGIAVRLEGTGVASGSGRNGATTAAARRSPTDAVDQAMGDHHQHVARQNAHDGHGQTTWRPEGIEAALS
jgi:hypothetical protein